MSQSEARKLLGRQANGHFPDSQIGTGRAWLWPCHGARTTSQEGKGQGDCIQDQKQKEVGAGYLGQ